MKLENGNYEKKRENDDEEKKRENDDDEKKQETEDDEKKRENYDDEKKRQDDKEQFLKTRPPIITKEQLQELLSEAGKKSEVGREIFEKLCKKVKQHPKYQKNIWIDSNFRVDPGHTLHGYPETVKTWNLQVNTDAKSRLGKTLLGEVKGKTHRKLLWGFLDLDKDISYEAWVLEILKQL